MIRNIALENIAQKFIEMTSQRNFKDESKIHTNYCTRSTLCIGKRGEILRIFKDFRREKRKNLQGRAKI